MKFYFSPEEVREINRRAASLAHAQDQAVRTGAPLDFPMTKSLEFSMKFVPENYTREDIRRFWEAAYRAIHGEG